MKEEEIIKKSSMENSEYSELRQASKEIFMEIANDSGLSRRVEENKELIKKDQELIKNLDNPKKSMIIKKLGNIDSSINKSFRDTLQHNEEEFNKINSVIARYQKNLEKSDKDFHNTIKNEFSSLYQEVTNILQSITLLKEEINAIYSSNNKSLTDEMAETKEELKNTKKLIDEKTKRFTDLNNNYTDLVSKQQKDVLKNVEENHDKLKEKVENTNKKVDEVINLNGKDRELVKENNKEVESKFNELKNEIDQIKQNSTEQFKSSNLVTRTLLGLNFIILVVILIFQFI